MAEEQSTESITDKSNTNGKRKSQSVPNTLPRLAHVINFFPCPSCPDKQFRPLDQAQNVTMASMQRAVRETTKAIPTIYAAVFEGDEFIIPKDFVTLSQRLTRSTQTEYPKWSPTKQLPFLDDILSSLYKSDNVNAFDYVIYSNSDIAVQNNFYDKVANVISKGFDGFAINRRMLPKKTINGRLLTGNDLDLMYKIKGKRHPGIDCIVHKKDFYGNKFTLGNVFLGFPPVGRTYSRLVERSSQRFCIFSSFETWGTFHLGFGSDWIRKPNTPLYKQNLENEKVLMASLNMDQY